MLLTEKIVKSLSLLPRLDVQLSIDSIVPSENEMTRGPKHLEKALKVLELLMKYNVPVVVSSVLTKINFDSQAEFHAYFEKMKINSRNSAFFIAGERSKSVAETIGFRSDEWIDFSKRQFQKLPRNKIKKDMAIRTPSGVRRYGCGAGYGTIAIGSNGMVTACNHLTSQEFILGDVRKESIVNIAQKGKLKFQHFDVDSRESKECRICPVRYQCAGGCKGNLYHATGESNGPTPECDYHKLSLIESLWFDTMGEEYCWPFYSG